MTDPRDLAERAIKAAEENAERQIAEAEGKSFPATGPFAEHDAARDAEDAAEAKGHGISVAELKLARQIDQDPEEIAALRGAHTEEEVKAAMAQVELKRTARAEAERQRRADEVKRG